MTDLAAWLLEQIDEDERAANAAVPGPWRHSPDKHWRKPGTTWFEEAVFAGPVGADAVCVAGTGETDDPQSQADATHIARWDPARVLAECDTKRKLVEFWSQAYQNPADADRFSGPDWDRVRAAAAWTLRKLAEPYRERPGYREEWRP